MTRSDHMACPSELVVQSGSEEDTDRLGTLLADVLQRGDIVALHGDLGAGKTRLVRAVVSALCPEGHHVSSPTFVLLQRYDGPLPVFHFDAYRLGSADEFLQLGPEEIFEEGGVCFIEWAARVAEALPEKRLTIDIRVTGPHGREFHFVGSDNRSREIIRVMQQRLQSGPS